ncbi:transcriptional regulator with XRE-family HTH domain [Catenuloplanes nepalensis]|uniref:Transcriptional regulator with XRE-family HTH domain n=1 Tax=Catenuloplanes nepalensis TaxID=587533 RepID=A0ABT9MMA6_9ACTN|nr:helix-turn-helix transcriptional regulator [Catenuloplanes nepalensis]MDP9792563.1 transcriptional regulator with XRE-family HTH domain [Catenuloplanes nepalensis]
MKPIVGGSQEAVQLGRIISGARRAKGWSQSRLADRMRRQAEAEGFRHPLPSDESFKAMISRWENGRKVPDINYRGLLCRVLGIAPAQLGLAGD